MRNSLLLTAKKDRNLSHLSCIRTSCLFGVVCQTHLSFLIDRSIASEGMNQNDETTNCHQQQ